VSGTAGRAERVAESGGDVASVALRQCGRLLFDTMYRCMRFGLKLHIFRLQSQGGAVSSSCVSLLQREDAALRSAAALVVMAMVFE
jgi:hypothetical protein